MQDPEYIIVIVKHIRRERYGADIQHLLLATNSILHCPLFFVETLLETQSIQVKGKLFPLSHSILLPTRHCCHLNYSWSPTPWVPRTVSCDPYSLPPTFKSWYFQTRKGSGWQKFVIVFVWYSLLYNVLSIENKIGNLLVADWNFCRSA